MLVSADWAPLVLIAETLYKEAMATLRDLVVLNKTVKLIQPM